MIGVDGGPGQIPGEAPAHLGLLRQLDQLMEVEQVIVRSPRDQQQAALRLGRGPAAGARQGGLLAEGDHRRAEIDGVLGIERQRDAPLLEGDGELLGEDRLGRLPLGKLVAAQIERLFFHLRAMVCPIGLHPFRSGGPPLTGD